MRILHDNVLILPFEAEEKTKGGIIIPSTAKEKPTKGKVISVGTGTKDEVMVVKDGDVVLYGKYSGREISHENVDYILLKQSDIYCIVE